MSAGQNSEKDTLAAPATSAEAERWWWDELGVLVEHQVWHLPRLAQEQASAE